MKLCVLGMGYVGLPTALLFAKQGLNVHGVDINPEKVERLLRKQTDIHEAGLNEILIEAVDSNKFTVSAAPEEADVFIIAVPTPLTNRKKADLKYVKAAAEMILPFLKKGNLVILESTVSPGTTTQVLIPILQRSNLAIGEECFVSHTPERVLPGRLLEELAANDRIVGAINEESGRMTVDLYRHFVKGTFHITDPTTAEMVKLIENSYRDVNIAFANELARIAETIGFNVWEAIQLANSHPRVRILQPGPGVGGHCIAVDPWFVVEKAPAESRMISLARRINDAAPDRVVRFIEANLRDIHKPAVALLGLSYKENVGDTRESPSYTIWRKLLDKGCEVKVYDPYIDRNAEPGMAPSLEAAATAADCLVLLTNHDEFRTIDFLKLKKVMRHAKILDTRNALGGIELAAIGFDYCLL